MRMYYVFDVKDEVVSLYKDNPVNLFKILDRIYYMHREELDYGFNLFKQLTNRIKVKELDNRIYFYLHHDITYSKTNEGHVINDLYNDEISILKIKSSHMVIQSNKSISLFFKILKDNYHNYFVCDFLEKDFFFIDDILCNIKNK